MSKTAAPQRKSPTLDCPGRGKRARNGCCPDCGKPSHVNRNGTVHAHKRTQQHMNGEGNDIRAVFALMTETGFVPNELFFSGAARGYGLTDGEIRQLWREQNMRSEAA